MRRRDNMFQDNYSKEISSSDSLVLRPAIEEDARSADFDEKKHWKITDVIKYADGTQEVREYYNLVVDDCSRLIASLMKRQNGFQGITYWAVGSGNSSWNNQNPPSPIESDTKLLNETFRKVVTLDDIKFLDVNNNPTANVTNRLEIKVTFLEGEANGELREFGLFGGNATGTKDSGIMINRKTHGLIFKTSGMQLERTIRIVF